MVATTTAKKPLGQLLVDNGLVTPAQLELVLQEQKKHNHQKLLGELLVEMQICSDDQVTEALAVAYGVPYARISPKLADAQTIALLPKEFLEKHQVLPLFLVDNVLTVAVSEPANLFLLEEIERISGFSVQLVAATARDIKSTLQTYLPNDKIFVIDEIMDDAKLEEFTLIEQKIEDIGELKEAAGDSPVIKLVNYMVYTAVREGASDIHIEPHENALRIRLRIDGRLVEKMRPPAMMASAVASRIKIMAGLDISERRLPQDGGIHVMMDKRPVDLRVSTMPGRHGEKVVIRIIDNDKASVNLEMLGFGVDTLKEWRRLINLPHGILLVTGPTGSGKTTSLYAALKELNVNDVNICTIEDPVEYNLAGVNQFQVNERAGFTFAGALRSLLRQDPDIIMVGEIRDGETARLATQGALTGHLVLSTLHTNDAAGAITRLINLGIEPYLVAASVTGVLAQRLVRKLCPQCRQAYTPQPNELRILERTVGAVQTLYKPVGCKACHNLGFVGRIGIYELLAPTDEMYEIIANGATLHSLKSMAQKGGMISLRDDGLAKVRAGITTLEEVYRATA